MLAKSAGLCVLVSNENIHMPKRIGNLFEKCFTIENLYAAFFKARKGKRKSKSVLEFEWNLGANIQKLYDEVHTNNYIQRPYKTFEIKEPKPRTVHAPHFRDTVIQHAIYSIIYPIFDKTFIHDSYGCRKNKGTHKASDRNQQLMRMCSNTEYYLKLDIRKFYYSIDHTILEIEFLKKIKDNKLINLMMTFVSSNKGVPIGNLLSQLYALIYLNPMDHFIKRELRITNYLRYVDDFVLIGYSKEKLSLIKDKIELFISNLKLSLSKWSIQQIKRGINFVGFRTWQSKRFVRKHSLHYLTKCLKLNKLQNAICILGNSLRTSSYNHINNRITNHITQNG